MIKLRRTDVLLRVAALIAAAVAGYLLLNDSSGGSAPNQGPEDGALVWAVGDGADGGEDAKAVAGLIRESDPDRFIYLGDVYEYGTAEEFDTNYDPVYGALREITLPTPGNHEWPTHEEGYDPYWQGTPAAKPSHTYATTLAGWEILSLNSEAQHHPDSRQVEWLRRQVEEPGTCRIAFWHAPRFSAGKYADASDLEPLWDALQGHAVLVLTGHDHNMQRFRPIEGITELISGAGGHERYEVNAEDPRLTFFDDEHYGALRLELAPGEASFRFVDAEGTELDSGRVDCEPLE